ncbi:MAG TPA: hypothetical protein PKY59_26680 [Pyrinomonadaceae bacterium]|nr:hypothetical protein [Pyrinomonadaceae bacterium]
MDDEKLEKTMEFILNNQAQFSVDIQKIQEAHKEAEKRVSSLERVSLNLYNATVEQGKNIAQISLEIKELRELQKETDERLRETDERLNAVIYMAEKFFSGGNGKSNKEEK